MCARIVIEKTCVYSYGGGQQVCFQQRLPDQQKDGTSTGGKVRTETGENGLRRSHHAKIDVDEPMLEPIITARGPNQQTKVDDNIVIRDVADCCL